MVSPSRRRAAVTYLVRRHKVSERRSCRLLGQHRSTQRHDVRPPDYEVQLVKRMNGLAAEHPRWGYRRVWTLLRQEGFEVNLKRIHRLWRRFDTPNRTHPDTPKWTHPRGSMMAGQK